MAGGNPKNVSSANAPFAGMAIVGRSAKYDGFAPWRHQAQAVSAAAEEDRDEDVSIGRSLRVGDSRQPRRDAQRNRRGGRPRHELAARELPVLVARLAVVVR